MNKINYHKAFTLLELLIVVAIIGLLIAIAVPTFWGIIARARDTTIKASLDGLPDRAMIFETAHGTLTGFCASPTKADMRDAIVGTGIPANQVHCLETPGLVTMSSALHTTGAHWLVDSARGTIGYGAGLAGLVGWWEMNEGAGTIVNDRSGNANHGTMHNFVSPHGWVGGAISFDGVNDQVVVSHSASLDITVAATTEAWINVGTIPLPIWVGIVGKESSAGLQLWGGDAWGRGIGAKSTIGGTWHHLHATGLMVEANRWYHLVSTFDGTTWIVYVDGVERNRRILSGSLLIDNHHWIIGRAHGWHFNGLIDEVRIYNRALTAEEIAASFRRGR